VRFLFGGACCALAGLVAKRYSPELGGLFLAFPAIFPAGASLIESHERRKKREIGKDGTNRGRMAAGSDAAGAATRYVGLALFGWIVWRLLPRLNPGICIGLASLAWIVITPVLWELRKRRFFARKIKPRSLGQ
jgi:hypothetical protein